MKIRELIKRDLDVRIPEVIQVDAMDEEQVYNEIRDYVVTDRIREEYRKLLDAYNAARTTPTDDVGVWISGFFGSGKSSFAKNLGHVLANPEVLGKDASALFVEQVEDDGIASLVKLINRTIPTTAVMFDISKERALSNSVAQVMYRALLGALGYAEDFDVAELEINLEAEGTLDEFVTRFNTEYAAKDERSAWTQRGRSSMSQVWNRAGAILNAMDPRTYPTPESFAQGLAKGRVAVNPAWFVERAFDLMRRRRTGHALVFVMDEVGAYVAQNEDRLEELRAITEEFGKRSHTLVRARQAVAPTWVLVTSQERLDEVVDALGTGKKVLLAKVQDRFHYKIDLSPADIREVTTRRVLSKTEAGQRDLEALFQENEGVLTGAVRLERTARDQRIDAATFARFYPYLPHYIELSIDIVSGLRLQQAGAVRHIGGSNRTIISQVHQMLINPRTRYADKPVNALVTLDRLFDLLEGLVGSARTRDLAEIDSGLAGAEDSVVRQWAGRVARVISLLEYVRDLPRTPHNIAALLVDTVGAPSPEPEVKKALSWLVEHEFARETDQGYKLQTAQEKSWTGERKSIVPKPKDRNEIVREVVREVFEMPALRTYNYQNQKNLRVGVTIDNVTVNDGAQLPLHIVSADDAQDLPRRRDDARTESRQPEHRQKIYWVFALTDEIHGFVAQLFASRGMIAKYAALQAQTRITEDERGSLINERQEEERLKRRLREKLIDALGGGEGVFGGISTPASNLGGDFTLALRALFEKHTPSLYPKLELIAGAKSIKGSEPSEILQAANLNGLSQVFYDQNGLGLVTKQGDKFLPNINAPTAKEVHDFLKREHSYGNRVTGKTLSDHFGGLIYGWDDDVLRIIAAALLRAGAIEVTHQGRRFRNHQDPQCRAAFEKPQQFRAAGFSPRETIDMKALVSAVRSYEELTGDEVDVEETVIAGALKKLAADELNLLLPALATARANRLPVVNALEEYEVALRGIQNAASDDCVRTLQGEGATLKASRERARAIREALTEGNLGLVRGAQAALSDLSPDPELAADLRAKLASDTFYAELGEIRALTQRARAAYAASYVELHTQRNAAYSRALEDVAARTELGKLPEETRAALLAPLRARLCDNPALEDELKSGAARCSRCGATPSEMRSDLLAVGALKAEALQRVQDALAPEQQIVRVRAGDFFRAALDTPEAIDEAVDALRAELQKRLAEGNAVVVEWE